MTEKYCHCICGLLRPRLYCFDGVLQIRCLNCNRKYVREGDKWVLGKPKLKPEPKPEKPKTNSETPFWG